MEEFMKPRAHNKGAAAAALAMHRDSHMVSKMKPKIRIVHIFAPEIIKTDVENFRELVQRLTGKPTKGIDGRNKKKKAAAAARPRAIHPPEYREASQVENVKRETGEEEEEEEEEEGEEGRKLWVEGSSGGFLNGLEEDDDVDFFHGFGEYSLFPFLSMDDVQQ
ncbi:VQ motif-containing protein 25-like [Typha angustifolia]|uniref:VQ motif-containing protein 25-like n=1 Tax=Typha angustifolia TaxID=59011 RepID=UPI003C2AE008